MYACLQAIEHHSFNYQQIVSGLSAIIMMGVVIGGYVIVIITSKQIFSKLNKVRMSEKTKRLQKQLAILMISQVCITRNDTLHLYLEKFICREI